MGSRGQVRRWVVIAALAVLGGCAALPSGPLVPVQPGSKIPFDVFTADDLACRQWTVDVLGGPGAVFGSAYESQARYDHAYVQCMYARGHAVPSEMVPPMPEAAASRVR